MKAKDFDEKFDVNNEDIIDDLDLDSIKRPCSMKKIPNFKTEQDEREFWETHDSTDYLDWSKAQLAVFPNLKKTTKAISLRMPEDMLAKVKVKANSLDVPYQSLIKTWIAEKV